MKKLLSTGILLATIAVCHATLFVGPWTPIFKGIDHAVGTNFPSTTITNNGVIFTDSTLQVVHCVRVDLRDPDVQLFTTPRAPNWAAESRETLSLRINSFVKNFGVQVAADANFYNVFPGGSDPTAEGLPSNVYGLLMSTGQVVSAADNSRYASLMFTTNKVPVWNLNNRAPGTNTTGIYTAVSGFYPVLTNGVNVWALYYNDFYNAFPDSFIHGTQPRTAFGISQDQRYLFMMTIDGRQPGYSDGALDAESAMWLLQFGGWDGINMDGGGSTAMYMADCAGNPVALNHSSLLAARGAERIIGDHFGVYAKPLSSFISNVSVTPGDTTATVTWDTLAPASSQVQYGLNSNLGNSTAVDATPVTSHSVVVSGLIPGTRYFYRVNSSDGATLYSTCVGSFYTTNNAQIDLIFGLTKTWKFNTASLDGINWQDPAADDSSWTGSGAGVLWADSNNPGGGPDIQFLPRNPQGLPLNPANLNYPYTTYYFRTHFTYTNRLAGVSLIFSNYIDDGAAFYLNGVLINTDFVPIPAFNSTLATGFYCPSGNANCPYVFTVSGDLAGNLRAGDNVVAVEVHNYRANSPDITFGQALFSSLPPAGSIPPPFITNLVVDPGETTATITWTTLSNSTSRVQYGLTPTLGSSTPLDSTPVTNHSVTLSGLKELTNYYFRVLSSLGATQYTASGAFSTVPFYINLVSLTNIWAYQTNNLDGVAWQARDYDESLFLGDGPALLYIETNPDVFPRNTPLPATDVGGPYPTYYFRTHFVFDTNLAGLSLQFTSQIDDGAIFYLNGTEIQRVRMPPAPQPISYTDVNADCPPVNCDVLSSAPDIFRISGDLMTNLLAGADNVLAAEVHQHASTSSDIVFGSAVGLVRALASETKLQINRSGDVATIAWDGAGFTLQQSTSIGTNSWSDVPGPVKTSPYSVTNPPAASFYRLRN